MIPKCSICNAPIVHPGPNEDGSQAIDSIEWKSILWAGNCVECYFDGIQRRWAVADFQNSMEGL